MSCLHLIENVSLASFMDWLLFIATVPGPNGGLRLRLWRQLKASGGASLRDGVYLLPWRADLHLALDSLRSDLLAAGGDAYVLRHAEQDEHIQEGWIGLFERGEEYAQWQGELDKLLANLAQLAESDARRLLRHSRKSLDTVKSTDYFPGAAAQQSEGVWHEAQACVIRHYSADEPVPASRDIVRLDGSLYRGRRWATRCRPWVDRVASAWLIKRFIDPDAQFVWLTDVHDCPQDALGFDFDGAAFTHVGDKVSFEVLLASFGLGADTSLTKLAALVHALDVGTERAPEALGFEAILAGARRRINNDDALLTEIGGTLDSLYAYFQDASESVPLPRRAEPSPTAVPAKVGEAISHSSL